MVLHKRNHVLHFLQAIKAWSNEKKEINNNIQKGVDMTTNQLTYWRDKENARHNKATEIESNRHNVAVENETKRANLVREGQNSAVIAETNRHNVKTETLEYLKLLESKRNNQAKNFTDLFNAQTNRMNATANTYNAETNRINAGTNQYNAYENARHNLAAETTNLMSLAETKANNYRTYTLSQQSVSETARHNLANENQAKFNSLVQYNSQREQARHNAAIEMETSRHNKYLEPTQRFQAGTQGIYNLSKIGTDAINSVTQLFKRR